ncbi:cysteine synthase [Labilibaculum filiforme]|uniref:cysteine synthase n=1 Tax=Labilibaculum filiforme TaxID=1940526 RepID=A0A2N3I0N4_9BACT|nr:PLP-dependent cysteine synthase family protein [Labilibaculum filiforme]PKQ63895.1 cysteine synthase [Labilibaculum filiforme]
MEQTLSGRIHGISSLIGNTPLLAIEFEYKGTRRTIYAKAEYLNMTGSIKDRMAYHIIEKAYESGALREGDQIIEATSGNTGIAFSGIGRAMGHPVTIFMPDWMSKERINLMKSYGANIKLVSKEEGGFLGSIDMANQLAEGNSNTFLPLQFSNGDNCEAHYKTTAQELWWQLKYRNLIPDAFVAGVGTGGTVMGVGKYLKEQNPNIQVHPLEPSNSPTMSTGHKVGKHRIQGISDEFIPSIVELNKLDDIVSVDDGDAIIMAQKLSSILGLGVGISSGANFLGALKIQDQLGGEAVVVTVFADDNKKYLSTDLMNEEPIKKEFLAPNVKLHSFRSFKRVCHTCCDPTDCVESEFNDSYEMLKLPLCPRRS